MTIKEMRKASGLSQDKFAEAVGIPVTNIRSWEQGARTPPDYVVKLLQYYCENEYMI